MRYKSEGHCFQKIPICLKIMSTFRERVLVRIEAVSERYFVAVVPGWNPHTKVIIDRELVPEQIACKLAPGDHVLARVNLSAVIPSKLQFSDFEEAPEAIEEL